MNGFRRIAAAWGTLAATLVLSACATHKHAGPHPRGFDPHGLSTQQRQLLLQDTEPRNGIRDQDERVQSVKTCRADPCDLTVTASDQVVEVPGAGYNCGVTQDFDILLLGRAVTQIGWILQPMPPGSTHVFRFAPIAPARMVPFGVYLYAEAGRQRFAPSEPKAGYFVLTPQARGTEGFAYGVYLEWKPRNAPDSDYQACIGLDPIIIEHN
jgi:hypothetical protein